MRDPNQIAGFLNPDCYRPASPFEFGDEMQRAVTRLQQAHHQREKVAIWGDFDADGITATSVLWDGLGQFFQPHDDLTYWIPNRLTQSHGLSPTGLQYLAEWGCQLIVTCDTGSTNLAELEVAAQLGIDVIVTDHHTLPAERPPVVAIINPRYLPTEHPLAHLSGVAVAYKLVEALYETLPDIPQRPLDHLLDLVAIGLIADLVELTGDCRYLAQKGIQVLQTQVTAAQPSRPGVAHLLNLCRKSGDRPTDISFGVGPRINAISRIHGDAHFCVELLTSQDDALCRQLANETELANARRKALQKDMVAQVKARLSDLDLSTTGVIVLADDQWSPGILGLVAGQIAQEFGRPTILLSTQISNLDETSPQPRLARGSARSVNQIDLYQLVNDQSHLLQSFGGHPYAAGLSLPVENVPLFTQAINRQLRERYWLTAESQPAQRADLSVTVSELGKGLFQELKLLEPYGMGNPVPRLLIENCWFTNVWNRNIKDWRGQTVRYIKTEFQIWDATAIEGFPGVWWEHYKDELPTGRCDAIAELDFNTYAKRYELRLIAVRPMNPAISVSATSATEWLLDWRQNHPDSHHTNRLQSGSLDSDTANVLQVTRRPTSWNDLQPWFWQAQLDQRPLAIAYSAPELTSATQAWQLLIGIAKYLHRTGKPASYQQIQQRLDIGDRALELGLAALQQIGFELTDANETIKILKSNLNKSSPLDGQAKSAIEQFQKAVQEELFRQRYFYEVPFDIIQAVAEQSTPGGRSRHADYSVSSEDKVMAQ
jgi:single-stranded-DNA-specific exonuclease